MCAMTSLNAWWSFASSTELRKLDVFISSNVWPFAPRRAMFNTAEILRGDRKMFPPVSFACFIYSAKENLQIPDTSSILSLISVAIFWCRSNFKTSTRQHQMNRFTEYVNRSCWRFENLGAPELYETQILVDCETYSTLHHMHLVNREGESGWRLWFDVEWRTGVRRLNVQRFQQRDFAASQLFSWMHQRKEATTSSTVQTTADSQVVQFFLSSKSPNKFSSNQK